MTITIGTGFNSDNDSYAAGLKAAESAVARSGMPKLTFLFTTDNYDQQAVFRAVKTAVGSSGLVGACVPGIITGEGVFKKGVGIMCIGGAEIDVSTCLVEDISSDPYSNGEEAGRILGEKGARNGTVFLFPDGFASNISTLLRGIYNSLGPSYKYVGGGTGDNMRFHKTYQFTEEGVVSDGLAAAVVRGISFKTGVGHGWKPLAQPLMVTRAEGKKVYELDGVPAFQRYSECLGGVNRKDFPYYGMKHPLGIPGKGGDFQIRDPISVEEDDSIIFVTEVPQDIVAMVMEGNIHELVETAAGVSEKVCSSPSPAFVLIFDCISRYLLMGERFKEELTQIKKSINEETAMTGIFTFGEVSCASGIPFFYNKSLVMAGGY